MLGKVREAIKDELNDGLTTNQALLESNRGLVGVIESVGYLCALLTILIITQNKSSG